MARIVLQQRGLVCCYELLVAVFCPISLLAGKGAVFKLEVKRIEVVCYFDCLVYVARVSPDALGSHFNSSFAAWSVLLNLIILLDSIFIRTRQRPLFQVTLKLAVLLLKLNR